MIQQLLAALRMVGQSSRSPLAVEATPFSSGPADVWNKHVRDHERQSAYEQIFEDSHSAWAHCMSDGEQLAQMKCRNGFLPGNRASTDIGWQECLSYWADGAPEETIRSGNSKESSAQGGVRLGWEKGPLAVEVGGGSSSKSTHSFESARRVSPVVGYREACNALEEQNRKERVSKLPEWMRAYSE